MRLGHILTRAGDLGRGILTKLVQHIGSIVPVDVLKFKIVFIDRR